MWKKILIILLFITGLGILAHQALTSNAGWFQPRDFLHHENIALVTIAFACGILLSETTKGKN